MGRPDDERPHRADLTSLLVELADAGVEFILVGGLAAVAQGVPLSTFDVDIVHCRTPANVARLLQVLHAVAAHARGRPPQQRLLPSEDALLGPGHQLLMTDKGALDVLGAIEDGQTYEDLIADSMALPLRGRTIHVLRLHKLADLKRGATRTRDQMALLLIDEALAAREDRSS